MSAEIAARLDAAQRTVTPIEQLPADLEIVDAYTIQHAIISRRLARNERMAGIKLGFTSEAKMAQMGVSEVILGQFTDAMRVADGADVLLSQFIHPRIEPEVAFRLAHDIDVDAPPADAVTCVDAVAPALEIIDSRYRDFRFSLPDVIADNASAAAFVIGSWTEVVDLGDRSVRLRVDHVDVESGSTADILGHPINALKALLGMAKRYGFALRGGQVVLAGAATAAVPFAASLVEADVAGLGVVSVRGTR